MNHRDYPIRTVQVQTCGELYSKWKEKKSLYKNCPLDGISVQIEYADTLNMKDASGQVIGPEAPTVVCLHGAPGSHKDYQPLIKLLASTGFRVIVPNFPSKFLPFRPEQRGAAEESINCDQLHKKNGHSSGSQECSSCWLSCWKEKCLPSLIAVKSKLITPWLAYW